MFEKKLMGKLSKREISVLGEIVISGCLKVAAKNLNISPRTVEAHLINIKDKLNIKYKYQLNKVFINAFYVRNNSLVN